MGILGIFTWGGTIAGFLVVLIGYLNPDFGRLLMGAALGYLIGGGLGFAIDAATQKSISSGGSGEGGGYGI